MDTALSTLSLGPTTVESRFSSGLRFQNTWSNTSEDLSLYLGIGIKYGQGPDWARLGLLELSSVLAALEADIARLDAEREGSTEKQTFEGNKSLADESLQRVKAGMLLQAKIMSELWRRAQAT